MKRQRFNKVGKLENNLEQLSPRPLIVRVINQFSLTAFMDGAFGKFYMLQWQVQSRWAQNCAGFLNTQCLCDF